MDEKVVRKILNLFCDKVQQCTRKRWEQDTDEIPGAVVELDEIFYSKQLSAILSTDAEEEPECKSIDAEEEPTCKSFDVEEEAKLEVRIIRLHESDDIVLKVDLNSTVRDVKRELCRILGKSEDQQLLTLDDNLLLLEDDYDLGKRKIKLGLTLVKSKVISVNNLADDTKFQVNTGDVATMKRSICELTGLDSTEMRLYLSDEYSIDLFPPGRKIRELSLPGNIFVSFAGKHFTIDVSPYEKGVDFMKKLKNITGAPINQQRLIFCGKQIERDCSLLCYGIKNECTVYLVLRMRGGGERARIQVKKVTGEKILLDMEDYQTIGEAKQMIEEKTDISRAEQQLVFNGKFLQDNQIVSKCCPWNSTVYLLSKNQTIMDLCFPKDIDHQWDYDYRVIDDSGRTYTCAGRQYERPCGWYKFGLRVLDKYQNNDWLGKPYSQGQETNEWTISYHGTRLDSAVQIVMEHYDVDMQKRSSFGDGIYSTPSIRYAEAYCEPFEFDGKHYKIVFQNRVDPKRLKEKHGKLVDVARGETIAEGPEYLTEPVHIRPYGVLVREVQID